MHLCFFFFFSSRRRHTRSLRDWSSDVCSSDLEVRLVRVDEAGECTHPGPWRLRIGGWATVPDSGLHSSLVDLAGFGVVETRQCKDTNPLGPVSEVPVLLTAAEVGYGRV